MVAIIGLAFVALLLIFLLLVRGTARWSTAARRPYAARESARNGNKLGQGGSGAQRFEDVSSAMGAALAARSRISFAAPRLMSCGTGLKLERSSRWSLFTL